VLTHGPLVGSMGPASLFNNEASSHIRSQRWRVDASPFRVGLNQRFKPERANAGLQHNGACSGTRTTGLQNTHAVGNAEVRGSTRNCLSRRFAEPGCSSRILVCTRKNVPIGFRETR
jgi:hypothetical protein